MYLANDFTAEGSTVYTDEAKGYKGMENRTHESVNHSANKYVVGKAHNNGLESLRSAFKRGLPSFVKVSPKHVVRYAIEFASRHNDRPEDTRKQMELLARGMVGRRLTYWNLITDNGRSNFARLVAGSEEEQVMLIKQEKRRRYKLWKAWKEGEISPDANADLAEIVAAKKAAGKWDDKTHY